MSPIDSVEKCGDYNMIQNIPNDSIKLQKNSALYQACFDQFPEVLILIGHHLKNRKNFTS
jgi:hypothetical protein